MSNSASRIAGLEAELAEARKNAARLRQDLADYKNSWAVSKRRFSQPSFYKSLSQYKDFVEVTKGKEFSTLPTKGMTNKLRNYAFAVSHGFAVPRIFQVARSIKKIDFSQLPDRFVLKTSGGSTSHGVLPLIRNESNNYDVADGSRSMTEGEVIDFFLSANKKGSAYGNVFAEEFLLPASGDSGIPDDIKVYCAYGQVMHVLLRSVDVHGLVSGTRSKYVDASGKDFGPVSLQRDTDPDIKIPQNLNHAVDVAKHLSLAAGVPFCRIDVYDTPAGIVFGEVTRAPGGAQTYVDSHDRYLGEQWLLGEARLLEDHRKGRPIGAIWGMHASPKHLMALEDLPSELSRATFRDCKLWC